MLFGNVNADNKGAGIFSFVFIESNSVCLRDCGFKGFCLIPPFISALALPVITNSCKSIG